MNRPKSTRAPYAKGAYGQSPPMPASPRSSYPGSPGAGAIRPSYPPSPSGQYHHEPITVQGVQERLARDSGPKEDFMFPMSLSPTPGMTPATPAGHHRHRSSGDVSPRHHSPTSSANVQYTGMQNTMPRRNKPRDVIHYEGTHGERAGDKHHRAGQGEIGQDLTQSLFAHMLALQSSLDDIRIVLDERDSSLRVFIQKELQIQRQSLSSEVLGQNQESYEEIRKLLGVREVSIDNPMTGVPPSRAPGVAVATQVTPPTSDSGIPVVTPLQRKVPPQHQAPTQASNGDSEAVQADENPKIIAHHATATAKTWEDFQDTVQEVDPHCIYSSILTQKIAQRSLWHNTLARMGLENLVDHEMPQNWAAQLTEANHFTSLQSLLIFANTGLMAYEADQQVKASLRIPEGTIPEWLATANLVFNIIFAVELLFRILALRSWFWVAPSDWGWNVLDVILVLTSLLNDLLSGVNISFIRTLRILRAIRVARIIRVLKFFRELRQMLFSILACLSSLAWAFVFLFMVMFMFTILFLQGMVQALDDVNNASNADPVMDEMRIQTEKWFGSVYITMESLLAVVTGGQDWVTVRTPLEYAGTIYSLAFVVYMLFVTVGVMNVLTGVFLSSANEFIDMSLIVQNEEMKVSQFCEQMLELFGELDVNHTGSVDWPTFSQALNNSTLRAYLSSLQLEPTHIRLIFDLLDERDCGRISVKDFVVGMVRLKGEAKAVDARVIQRELRMLPEIMDSFLSQKIQVEKPAEYSM